MSDWYRDNESTVRQRLSKRRRDYYTTRLTYALLCLLMFGLGIALAAAARGSDALAMLPPPTLTPTQTYTPTLTATPTATLTPAPTWTPLPTSTGLPDTATPLPSATLTLIPSITSTPAPLGRFSGAVVQHASDCSRTMVQGTIHDGNATLDGIRVRLWWPDAPAHLLFSEPSGENYPPGEYALLLDDEPRAGWWLVAPVDEGGRPLGDAVVVETTQSGCGDGTGRQVLRIDFRREFGALGVAGPTLTPIPPIPPTTTPLPPATATPLPTPDGASRTLKVPILMYHYVSVPPAGSDRVRHDLSVGPDLFRAQLITLREQGYTSITLTQLLYALELGAPLPDKPIVLTFDDGYRDNYENAFPILKEEGFVGTFFVVTSLVEERNVNYMTWEQIVEMKEAGMEIGSHTAFHLSLPTLSDEAVWRELTRSRALLEQRLGQEVRTLAYPGGGFDEDVVYLTQAAGYWAAVTTKQGVTHRSESPLTLRRIRVRGSMFPPDLLETIHYWMFEAQSEP